MVNKTAFNKSLRRGVSSNLTTLTHCAAKSATNKGKQKVAFKRAARNFTDNHLAASDND